MARRTKEESARTRGAIITAAREVFQHRGVAHTTIEQIAEAAGVTRGAFYFHFPDKTAVFYAVRDQVALPLMDRMNFELLSGTRADPLLRVELFLLELTNSLVRCAEVQATFDIMTFKCEYVDELRRELVESCRVHEELLASLTRVYREAARLHLLRAGVSATLAATGTMIFLSGLIRLWLMDEDGRLVRDRVRALIRSHVSSLRRLPTGT
ncbi:MAG: TetR family transcriptional regulator [Pseudomonadota bacterium]|nr:TetR family transcriptional regulator [Pseudomonadota bacterium]